MKKALKSYLQEMLDLYLRDDAPCITDYCSVLKDLLYKALDFLPGNISKDNVVIEVLEIPVGLQIHFPYIRIWDGKTKVYGYIDVLAPGTTPGEIRSYSAAYQHKQLFPNLLLTNFFVFFYYQNTGLIKISRPFAADSIWRLTREFEVRSIRILEIFENFITYSYRDSNSRDISFIRLQRELARKTFYLRHKVILPILDNIFKTGSSNEMTGTYNTYCDFFNEKLAVKEFSMFLSHLITDVFLRACIFYNNIQPGEDTGFSRQILYQYAKFTMMPERRKTLFKYLSSQSDQLPTALKWMLDDISDLLWGFDFKQMGFSNTNPLLIDGELLQWEAYFFKTYYDSPEEYQRVRALLQKDGIFSIDGKSHEERIGL